MKKILIVSALILVCFTANAQLKFGIKAGTNTANVSNSSTLADALSAAIFSESGVHINMSANTLFGAHVGVMGQFKVGPIGIQPEILFSMQGIKFSGSLSANGATLKADDALKLSYISVPVMFQYYVAPGLNIEAGPQVGFLLSAKEKANVKVSGAAAVSTTEDIKKDFNGTDFALNIGASYKLPVIPVGLFARYSLGISDIVKDNDSGKKFSNRVVQLGAFLRF